jgi:sporulation protein YlmC with PRC-barrel domain
MKTPIILLIFITLAQLFQFSTAHPLNAQSIVGNPLVSGSGCPSGSTTSDVVFDEKRSRITISVVGSIEALASPGSVAQESCNLRIPIQSQNYKIKSVSVRYQGSANISKSSNAQVSTTGTLGGKTVGKDDVIITSGSKSSLALTRTMPITVSTSQSTIFGVNTSIVVRATSSSQAASVSLKRIEYQIQLSSLDSKSPPIHTSTGSSNPLSVIANPIITSGSGCPSGSTRSDVVFDEKRSRITISVIGSIKASASSGSVAQKSCNLRIPIRLPQNYKIQSISISYQGSTNIPDGASGQIVSTAILAGKTVAQESANLSSGFNPGWEMTNNFPIMTSLPTSTVLGVNTSIVVRATSSSQAASFLLKSIEYQIQLPK